MSTDPTTEDMTAAELREALDTFSEPAGATGIRHVRVRHGLDTGVESLDTARSDSAYWDAPDDYVYRWDFSGRDDGFEDNLRERVSEGDIEAAEALAEYLKRTAAG